MTWAGKAECFKTIQQPSGATLIPAREESIDFDSTENIVIDGDNLEVLKLLQKSYFGKVKMIYIDPPYNTGNDFIYPDNYAENLDTYLRYTGQIDTERKKFSTNTESDGRFHSKWLSMMYPRLFLGRNLLRDDGYCVVSIDDAEFCNLRTVLNEVFGEENFLAVLVVDRNRKNDAKLFSVGHEYMMVYGRNKARLSELDVRLRAPKEGVDEIREEFERLRKATNDNWELVEKGIREYYSTFSEDDLRLPLTRFTKVDERGPFRTDGDPSWPGGGGPRYIVPHPLNGKPCKIPSRGWVWPTYERMKEEIDKGNIVFGPDETTIPSVRRNLFEKDEQVMRSVIFSYAQKASQDFVSIFGGVKVFENPKSYLDLEGLVLYLTSPGDIVLDFFSGSGTTAHGVLLANRAETIDRSFICVQLPEPVNTDTDAGRNAQSLGLKTISEIQKERIRRVIGLLKKDSATESSEGKSGHDLGFRVFKLAESNFRAWNAEIPKDVPTLEVQLGLHVDHVREGIPPENILYELLLKSGFPLSTAVETLTLDAKTVYSVADGAMLICLEKGLTQESIKAMADRKPERVVCLDESFSDNDQLKTNAVQTMKIKGVTSFRTV
jgi:adenine-specific DNA-methyltransferase